jgi:hypothetical protein
LNRAFSIPKELFFIKAKTGKLIGKAVDVTYRIILGEVLPGI